MVSKHFQNDDGWHSCRAVADLPALGYLLHGRQDEVWRRLDAYRKAGKTMVRVLGMLGLPNWVAAGLDFSPRTPGYEAAHQLLVDEAGSRGMYVKSDLFADAQAVVPDKNERKAMTRAFAAFCRANAGVLPGLSNEPYKNGWSSADDPALLELADLFAAEVGHLDFTIGDVGDDDQEASPNIAAKMATISRHCNIVAWHPSRSWDPNDKRWRRHLDHLEGTTEIWGQWRPGVGLFVEEPIGAALQAIPGRRDNDPEAFVAAQMISLLCGFAAYTYHWIPGELDVDQLPGFYDATEVIAAIPSAPEWSYRNDSWQGAPTDGMLWDGKEGKVRHLVNGGQAWSLAYGDLKEGSLQWRAGWQPTPVYATPRVKLWSVVKS